MALKQKADRPDYQATLKARAAQLYNTIGQLSEDRDGVEAVYQALKLTALESWKNGIEAGRRKARPSQAKSA